MLNKSLLFLFNMEMRFFSLEIEFPNKMLACFDFKNMSLLKLSEKR